MLGIYVVNALLTLFCLALSLPEDNVAFWEALLAALFWPLVVVAAIWVAISDDPRVTP